MTTAETAGASLKDCGRGCYLCFKEDTFGELYQHWAQCTPANAICYMEPSVTVPAFKFTANGGRIQLSQNVNMGRKFYEVYIRYVREMMKTYKATRITLLSHTQHISVQILFLKNSGQVFYLKEPGKSVLFEPSELSGIGCVGYNETAFLVQTMDQNLFLDKCTQFGAGAVP